jgi:hypothetical protein
MRLMFTLERDVCGLERDVCGLERDVRDMRAPGVLTNDVNSS